MFNVSIVDLQMVYSCFETVGGSTSANSGLMYVFHGRLHIQRPPEASERSPGHGSIAEDYNLKSYDEIDCCTEHESCINNSDSSGEMAERSKALA